MFSIVFVRSKWYQILRHCEWKNVIFLEECSAFHFSGSNDEFNVGVNPAVTFTQLPLTHNQMSVAMSQIILRKIEISEKA